jgi:hypothetical protein
MYNTEDGETQVVEKRRLEKDLSALLREVETKMGLSDMHFKFWHNGNARKLSPQVKAYMERKFDLIPEYLQQLRCFEHQGVFKENPVIYLRIFSPWRTKERGVTPMAYADLDRYPELILYEGHIAENGAVYVADRRQPVRETRCLRR